MFLIFIIPLQKDDYYFLGISLWFEPMPTDDVFNELFYD